jgi:hypothetical protein
VRSGVGRAPTSSCEADEGRGRAGRLEAGIGFVLTGLALRFVAEPGERLGFFGASASALMGLEERFGRTGWVVGQPDVDDKAG